MAGGAAEFASTASASVEKLLHLKSNEAINPIRALGHFLLGESGTGLRGVRNYMLDENGGLDFGKAVKKAYTKIDEEGKSHLNVPAIAGSYVTLSTAGRIVTGGGLYKDKNGNTNIIGVPFI